MRNTADVTGDKPIAVCSQSISVVTAINPLVASYDIDGRKREMIRLFCPGHHTGAQIIAIYFPYNQLAFIIQNQKEWYYYPITSSHDLKTVKLK
jgi:hypothetical protein